MTRVVVGVEDDEVLAVATLTDGWSGGAGRSGVGSTYTWSTTISTAEYLLDHLPSLCASTRHTEPL